ncbi:MAG TPA: response regulator [Labilithrix sp.]|jgi:CheY-like chemotaxis protein
MNVGIAAARRKSAPPEGPVTGTRRALRAKGYAPLVLLVDDTEEAREMYAEYFVHQGFRVAQATDGEHALLKVLTLMPDLVVMDLAMPVLDGWEATHQIKAHAKTKHIPVIALTGHVTPQDLRRAGDAGADAVLGKPCTPESLLQVVKRLLGH